MDVGVDNAFRILGEYRPFSFREIASIMESRPGFRIDGNGFTTPKTGVECLPEDKESCLNGRLSKITSDS